MAAGSDLSHMSYLYQRTHCLKDDIMLWYAITKMFSLSLSVPLSLSLIKYVTQEANYFPCVLGGFAGNSHNSLSTFTFVILLAVWTRRGEEQILSLITPGIQPASPYQYGPSHTHSPFSESEKGKREREGRERGSGDRERVQFVECPVCWMFPQVSLPNTQSPSNLGLMHQHFQMKTTHRYLTG